MRKLLFIALIGIGLLLALAWGVAFYPHTFPNTPWEGVGIYWENLRGAWFAVKPAAPKITEKETVSELPLKLPADLSISLFAKDLPGVRVMARDSFGNFWVSQTSEGVISFLEMEGGKVKSQSIILKNLKKPHGLAFDPENPFTLYFAEEDKLSKVTVYPNGLPQKIADLPSGSGHFTRTIGFGPDGRLYVSIGSSCNVCRESDNRRAAIYSMKKDGSDFKLYASGLRNAVFFTWAQDGKLWATDNGRDLLGDDLPPDEINIIESGKNYGWPICYGKNIHDTVFDKNTYIRNPCMEPFETPSYIDLQAHSAALGLAFVPQNGWPEDYQGNLIVAYHGSWNRTEPTGYKVVRVKLNSSGEFLGIEDFITGWLRRSDEKSGVGVPTVTSGLTSSGKVLGRPVGVFAEPGGVVYITDDKAGIIYKISRK
ncbi:MAG: PQQ-dependent sugar dehydrogenase [Candidatus Sungbacteria bacterium]|nr:PQQ-dependent sugar dehydrogenase [Candidatus Sungbacteria bacterium]